LERVVLDREVPPARVVELVSELSADEAVHIGLLIFPRLDMGRAEFEHLLAAAREEEARRSGGEGTVMALAAFHPEADPDLSTSARLVPFLRRSPDPTIQLVRMNVLEHVRRGSEHGTAFVDMRNLNVSVVLASGPPERPLHERVADANLELVKDEGIEAIEALFEDIRRDRERAYAGL
jgi:hypothetical protein